MKLTLLNLTRFSKWILSNFKNKDDDELRFKCTCATTEDEKLANALFVIEVEPSEFGLAIALAEG